MEINKNGIFYKVLNIIAGVVVGFAVWVATGWAAILLAGRATIFGNNPYWPAVIAYLAITALLVKLLSGGKKRKFLLIGMLCFFIAALLIPNPCSIYSLYS